MENRNEKFISSPIHFIDVFGLFLRTKIEIKKIIYMKISI